MKNELNQEDLPLKDLESIGLWKDGKPLLSKEDQSALLAGRRTSFVKLENLQTESLRIPSLDVKLSLRIGADSKPELVFHPIYKEAEPHPLLTGSEARELIEGAKESILKTYKPDGKDSIQVVLQYDNETREFVSYNPQEVQAPEEVNGQKLSNKQKDSYRNGEVITLDDQTRFRLASSDSKGILSDKAALVLSFLADGGISYLVIKGLRNLDGRLPAQGFSAGYEKALEDMNRHTNLNEAKEKGIDSSNHSRGYSRTGSR